MVIQELEQKYAKVPIELKSMKRWVCYRVEEVENGKTTKRPYNPLNGSRARVNDDITWSTFKLALNGTIKYDFDGIGFVLGDGIFGIDLDNHKDAEGNWTMSKEDFDILAQEFIGELNSYTEYSQSGNGIHIICKGKLPNGARRKNSVEMYDSNRFFAFTGNVINNVPIENRELEVISLWKKYVYTEIVEQPKQERHCVNYLQELTLSDEEVIERIMSSKQADEFDKLYREGKYVDNGQGQSAADMTLCNILAFWTNKDKAQMDRIFRNSALMRDKWDEYRGQSTYGEITLSKACSTVQNGFVATKLIDNIIIKNKTVKVDENGEVVQPQQQKTDQVEMTLDQDGNPIFRIKQIFKRYPYNDTGNAMLFYDYFGDLFRYNVTDKKFMYWTGKCWIKDETQIIRKYANRFIDILKQDEKSIENEILELNRSGQRDEAKLKEALLDMARKNTCRVANKAGKDAMLNEFQSLYDVAVESSIFDKNDYLLNTDSGIIDLETGNVKPFDRKYYMSKCTNTKVSFDEPKIFLNFLFSVFDNGNIAETQELIDSLQTCLGYSLTGSTKEQCMFLLYGGGSNGKSTLTEAITKTIGDYADNISSSVLMQQKGQSNNNTFSIAKLQTARFVETGETDEGGKFGESQVKILTGGDTISAQFKFGNEFSFKPKFKIWMSTNNKPIIRGTDLGIWRRIFMFPFLNSFTGKNKDKTLPDKLEAEKDKILGWMIQGYIKYKEKGELITPQCVQNAVKEYKKQMNVVAQYVEKECILSSTSKVKCRELYKSFKDWANDNTEFKMKESKFSEELELMGITRKKNNRGEYEYIGIRHNGVYIKNDE